MLADREPCAALALSKVIELVPVLPMELKALPDAPPEFPALMAVPLVPPSKLLTSVTAGGVRTDGAGKAAVTGTAEPGETVTLPLPVLTAGVAMPVLAAAGVTVMPPETPGGGWAAVTARTAGAADPLTAGAGQAAVTARTAAARLPETRAAAGRQ